jgi:NitT/TauT family transport system substrate-binding protein
MNGNAPSLPLLRGGAKSNTGAIAAPGNRAIVFRRNQDRRRERNAMRRLALVLALATAIAPASRAADTIRAGKASPTAFAMLPLVVGVAEGIYARHGLEVEVIDFGGGAKLHQATAAGSVDIGVGSGAELAMVAKGSPELAICNAAGPPLFIGIVVPADSPAHKAEDLKGKKIGVSSPNSMTYWMGLKLARHYGWGDDGVTLVTLGGDTAAIIAGFRTHMIDADIGGTSLAFQLEEKGQGRLLLPVSDYLGNMSSDTVFASKQLIASNPNAVRRFLAGWLEAVRFMRANKDETVRVAQKMTGFDPVVQAKEYDQSIAMFTDDCRFDAESLATLKQSFADLKLLDTAPDMKSLYTEEFVPQR